MHRDRIADAHYEIRQWGTGEADPLLELHVSGFGTHDWGPAPAAGGKDRRLPAAPDGQHLEVPKTGQRSTPFPVHEA